MQLCTQVFSPIHEQLAKTLSGRHRIKAKNQPPYNPLPCVQFVDGTVVTRWRMSLKERIKALFIGDVYLTVLTFNEPLQPVKLTLDATEAMSNQL